MLRRLKRQIRSRSLAFSVTGKRRWHVTGLIATLRSTRRSRVLDAEEKEAQHGESEVPTIEQTLAWLRDLPALWHAAEPSGRRLLAEAVFERIDVLGIGIAEITPTPEADAHGWSDAFGEPVVLSVNLKTGRGERSSADQHRPALLVINVCWSPSG